MTKQMRAVAMILLAAAVTSVSLPAQQAKPPAQPAKPTAQQAKPAASEPKSGQPSTTPGGVWSGYPPVYAAMPARPEGPMDPAKAGYKVDGIDLTLEPGQAVEYKFHLEQGAVMIYTWKVVEGANVRFDFHTVPDGKPLTASERFMAGETSGSSGVYTAPYAGLHGWWWENTSKGTATIRLNASGFFSKGVMFAPEPYDMEVKDPPVPEF
jgi:hypothetical protein